MLVGSERREKRGPRTALCGVIAAMFLLVGPDWGHAAYSEDTVKAVLLERIVSFLSWTDRPPSEHGYEIVVLENEGLARELGSLFANRAFAGHPLKVRQIEQPKDIGQAQIVIIGPAFASSLPEVLAASARRGLLTVADTPGFGQRGVALNFFREGSRMRFELRPAALKRAGIQPSYKLLALGRIIGEP